MIVGRLRLRSFLVPTLCVGTQLHDALRRTEFGNDNHPRTRSVQI
jgi:hypothetical protein